MLVFKNLLLKVWPNRSWVPLPFSWGLLLAVWRFLLESRNTGFIVFFFPQA